MAFNPFKKDTESPDIQLRKSELNELNNSEGMGEYMQMQNLPRNDLTKWQQNIDPILDEMEHVLRREQKDSNGQWITNKNLPPLCSNECIENLKAILKPNTSFNIMMSKLSEDQINNNLKSLQDTVLIDVLLTEWKKYGTPSTYLSQVKKIFRSFALPTYYRAVGGFEAINLRQIRTLKELKSDGLPSSDKKKGWIG